jgi:hypothetical protein
VAAGETHHERVNRELIELLNELRVVLPGVQVLFAFLLSLPFLTRFDELTAAQRGVYFVSFICAAAAIALLITPSAYHRLRFRQHDKERMLFTSNRLVIAGTVFLAISLVWAIYVVTDVFTTDLRRRGDWSRPAGRLVLQAAAVPPPRRQRVSERSETALLRSWSGLRPSGGPAGRRVARGR